MGNIRYVVFILSIALGGCHLKGNLDQSLLTPELQVVDGAKSSNGDVPLKGVCSANLEVRIYTEDGSIDKTVPCVNGEYSTTVTLSGAEGPKTIFAEYKEKQENIPSAETEVIYDLTPPAGSPSFTGWAGGDSNDVSARLVSVGSADTSVSGFKYILSQNANCSTQLAALQAAPENAINAQVSLSATAEGTYYVCTLLKDSAGNWQTSANQSAPLNIDLTPPAPVTGSPASNAQVRTTNTISGSCEDNGNNVVITGDIANAPLYFPCIAGSFSGSVDLTGSDGVKTINYQQLDDVGNTGTGTLSLVKDTTAPVLSVTSHTANQQVLASITLTGACENNGNVVTASGDFTGSPANANCVGGNYSLPITLSGVDGSKSITVQQLDIAGNTGSVTHSLVKDTTAPTVAVTSHLNDAETLATVTVAGTCENNGFNVSVTGAVDGAPVTLTCTAGTFSGSITLSGADGAKTFTLMQSDTAGNTASVNHRLVKDTTAPVITVTSPTYDHGVAPTFTISGTCEDNGNNVTVTGDITGGPVVFACVAGAFTGSLSVPGSDGLKNLTLKQLDDVTNEGSLAHRVDKDTTAPIVTISSPTNNSTIDPVGTSIGGNCTYGDTLTLGGTIAEAGQTIACAANGTWSTSVNFTQEGENQTLVITQTDDVGLSDSETYNLIADPPVFTITGARPALAVRGVACAMCHAKVKGDIVTDFGHGQSFFLGNGSSADSRYRPYEAGIYAHDWRDGVQIDGNLYTKNASVTVTDYVNALQDPAAGNSTPGGGWTLADVVTKQMYSTVRATLMRLISFIGQAPTNAVPGMYGSIVYKNNILIASPTAAQINALTGSMSLVATDSGVSIYKKSTATLANLNIVAGVGGKYVRNSGNVDCWGDVVIQGPLFLDNLQLNSRAAGCRLHVNGTVFIRGGITYLNEATYPKVNVQITSSRAIIVGMNPNFVFERFSSSVWPKVPTGSFPDETSTLNNMTNILSEASRIADLDNDGGPMMVAQYVTYSGGAIATRTNVGYAYNQTTDLSAQPARVAANNGWAAIPGQETTYNAVRGNCTVDTTDAITNSRPCILTWAGTYGKKTVNFNHLLLNAPIVHSRYFGLFKGIVIADFFMPAVEHLEYEYDSTFDSVPVLPLVIQNVYSISN
ncbi:hypothetical protein [Bdellovibrio reynosensis]|uniref:Hemagglutinin n=1 Tax=Bdellovibrio reynosensis TaxID=2835041 RepID=A0ABY4C7U3_9BACT|nr:hypothetical protein [Bdellovibrio reynosensis]UOF00995.1 hypothetical protein MNR06_14940 [Bdellovibrio reynosensis]